MWRFLDVLDDRRDRPLLDRDNRRDESLDSQFGAISC
jgi:hypothetical protein